MDGSKLHSDHHVLSRYFSVAVASLIIYDCSLTLCEEIRAVSARHAWTSGIALFLNRIFLTAIAILNILWVLPIWGDNGASCKAVGILNVTFNLLCVVITAVISALRVYVISKPHGSLTILTLVLGLVPVGTNVFISSFGVTSTGALTSICIYGAPAISTQLFTRAVILTRTCASASDLLVLVVTWIYTYDSLRQFFHKGGHRNVSITEVLLVDGTLYFIAIFILNIADLTLYFSDGGYDTLADFIYPISSILVSRFLLHIHKVGHSSRYGHGDFDTHAPSFILTHSRLQAMSSISFKLGPVEASHPTGRTDTLCSLDLSTTASTFQSEFSFDETDEEDWDWDDDRYVL